MERAGERAPRKFAETSNAKRVSQMCGIVLARNEGTAFGVDEDAINKCVVPGQGAEWWMHMCKERVTNLVGPGRCEPIHLRLSQ